MLGSSSIIIIIQPKIPVVQISLTTTYYVTLWKPNWRVALAMRPDLQGRKEKKKISTYSEMVCGEILTNPLYVTILSWHQLHLSSFSKYGPISASFSSLSYSNFNNKNEKSVDGVHGIRTRGRRMLGIPRRNHGTYKALITQVLTTYSDLFN